MADDQLRLMVSFCHPEMPQETQVAHVLKTLYRPLLYQCRWDQLFRPYCQWRHPLLKDVAKSPTYAPEMGTEALDTRVIKSVLMASTRKTTGWYNRQTVNSSGVTTTTQALDLATGAGALDLEKAATTYVGGTTDVAGGLGGEILATGWDFGQVGLGLSNDYLFDNPFATAVELTVSLNWFAGRSFDDENDLGANLSFSDLNLQVWQYLDGMPPELVAESISTYNNAEYLRITLMTPGLYGLSVVFGQLIYDLNTVGVTSENYGLAWQAKTVPEPSTFLLVLFVGSFLMIRSTGRAHRSPRVSR